MGAKAPSRRLGGSVPAQAHAGLRTPSSLPGSSTLAYCLQVTVCGTGQTALQPFMGLSANTLSIRRKWLSRGLMANPWQEVKDPSRGWPKEARGSSWAWSVGVALGTGPWQGWCHLSTHRALLCMKGAAGGTSSPPPTRVRGLTLRPMQRAPCTLVPDLPALVTACLGCTACPGPQLPWCLFWA